jgi:hypothetical protein
MSGHQAFLINTKNVTFIGKLKGNIFVKIIFDLKITGLLFTISLEGVVDSPLRLGTIILGVVVDALLQSKIF